MSFVSQYSLFIYMEAWCSYNAVEPVVFGGISLLAGVFNDEAK